MRNSLCGLAPAFLTASAATAAPTPNVTTPLRQLFECCEGEAI